MVAVDLDGTLLNDSKQISAPTVAALACLPAQGVKVVIASARPPRSVRAIYRTLGLNTLQINYNGALIWEEASQQAVFHQPLPGALVEEIVDFSRDLFEEIQVSCEVMDRSYTDRVDEAYTTETGRLFRPDVIAPLTEFCRMDTTKLLLLGEPAMMARLESELFTRFGERVTILQTDDHLLQIMHPKAGKAQAVRQVAEKYGVAMSNVMAIGDALNDMGMLQQAGVGIAMDNAHPELKKIAKWIAPSNNDHGVHAALVHYGLCGK